MDKERSKTLSMKNATLTECIRVSIYLDLNLCALSNHQMQISGWKGMAEVNEATMEALPKNLLYPWCSKSIAKITSVQSFFVDATHYVPIDFRLRYRGIEAYPHKGRSSSSLPITHHIDPFTIISGTRRRIHYLAKDGHFEKLATAIVMKTSGQIRTHRESGAADALSSASDVLSAGLAMGIFPEGTRSRRDQPPFLSEGKPVLHDWRATPMCPYFPPPSLARVQSWHLATNRFVFETGRNHLWQEYHLE